MAISTSFKNKFARQLQHYSSAFNADSGFVQDKTKGSYKAVAEQSGFVAGGGGYHVDADEVELKGGAIVSTADKKNNDLTANDLTYTDIANHAEMDVSSDGLALSNNQQGGLKYNVFRNAVTNSMNGAKKQKNQTSTTESVVSDGNFNIRSATGKDNLNKITQRDVNNANKTLTKYDIDDALKEVQLKRELKNTAMNYATEKVIDEAHKVIFVSDHPTMELAKNENGDTVFDENDNAVGRVLSKEEEFNLKSDAKGNVNIMYTGIFTDDTGAKNFADQYIPNQADNKKTKYVVKHPEASNTVAELAVAAYEKFFEGETLGYSKSTEKKIKYDQKYGNTGLNSYALSRGTLTSGNSLKYHANHDEKFNKLTENYFGPAQNVNNANKDYKKVTGKDKIYYEGNKYDLVTTIVGGNKPTTESAPKGTNRFREYKHIFNSSRQDPSSHVCGGMGTKYCEGKGYKNKQVESNKDAQKRYKNQ